MSDPLAVRRQLATGRDESATSDSGSAVSREWHTLSPAEVLALLGVEAEAGLGAEEARRRFARVGPNAVGEHPEAPLWRLRLAQFRSLVTRRPLGTMSLSAADWSVVTLSA